jgi:hypothetical protein
MRVQRTLEPSMVRSLESLETAGLVRDFHAVEGDPRNLCQLGFPSDRVQRKALTSHNFGRSLGKFWGV